jgi:1-deoxy-D-xylulose-5-phosphate reductoisomerase
MEIVEMPSLRTLAILGSTGSIGTSVLDVVDRLPGRFRVTALAAGGNISLLASQIRKYRPRTVSVARKEDAAALRGPAKTAGTRVTWGPGGAEEVAGGGVADVVVSAITGMGGFRPTLAAVRSGRLVALANKESMVVGGALLQREAARSGARIIPVDSEHSGIFQCLRKEKKKHVKKVILTASGGPFFRTPLKEIRNMTPEEALRHPRWKMGRKVTVDSATLMNKGLELIEARWLFGLEPERLDVLVHPQSAVHCLVETEDGSVLAQLSATDMRIPIQYALTYPEREDSSLPGLDLASLKKLEFYRVDTRRYPLFETARGALAEGGSSPVALNAANEIAVAAFLDGKIGFSDIADTVRRVMDSHRKVKAASVENILDIDREARRRAREAFRKKD